MGTLVNRWVAVLLLALLAGLQWPLWWGKGSWQDVRSLQEQVAAQKARNRAHEARNLGLAAEVHDLKTGFDAIEELARKRLDMVRPNEVMVRIPVQASPAPAVRPAQP